MKILMPLCSAAVFALAACSGETPAPVPSDTPEPAATALAPAPTAPAPTASPAPLPTTFPAAMAGRWGLVPADCTSQRGDNKGMITITANEIRFYESVAAISEASERTDDRLRAKMAFEGEGMQWTREVTLALKPAADQLVLEEFGSDAVPGPRTYSRCK